MAVNDLVINQASTILNTIMQQANIGGAMVTVDGGNFVSVGQTALKAGYDVILNAISQVLTRTIFSVRPYKGKLEGIMMDEQRFGNMSRKLSIADSDFADGEFDLPADGTAVDHYKIKRANVLQLNFYGANNYKFQSPTIFKDQLDIAFSSPDELVKFWGMVTSNAQDIISQAHENLRRATIANFIGAKIKANTDGIESGTVIHLLTEYNTETGLTLTSTTVKEPSNYPAFMQWVYGRIQGLCSLMTERSEKFHTNITGKAIKRHTPLEKQKIYLLNPEMYMMDARVLADRYHVNFLTLGDYEAVNFWQNIDKPDEIKVTPTVLQKDGTLQVTAEAISQANIFGVVFDEEALGVTTVNNFTLATPINADGAYTNIFYHFTDRYYTDFTENGFVLLMD